MFVIFLIFSLVLLTISFQLRNKLAIFSRNRRTFVSMMLIGIIGLTLIFFSGKRLQSEIARQNWPQVRARIVDSQVGGQRAYHPVIIYAYKINGKEYRRTTSLESPGFGTKNARRDTATRIISAYVPGDSITVFVNPARPAESYIRSGPYWSDYLQISTGLLLYSLGFLVLFSKLFARKTEQRV